MNSLFTGQLRLDGVGTIRVLSCIGGIENYVDASGTIPHAIRQSFQEVVQ